MRLITTLIFLLIAAPCLAPEAELCTEWPCKACVTCDAPTTNSSCYTYGDAANAFCVCAWLDGDNDSFYELRGARCVLDVTGDAEIDPTGPVTATAKKCRETVSCDLGDSAYCTAESHPKYATCSCQLLEASVFYTLERHVSCA